MKPNLSLRVVVDMLMINACWVLAYFLRFHSGMATPLGIPDAWLYFKLLPFITIIWATVFYAMGFYRRSARRRSAFLEGLDILQCCIAATITLVSFTYFYEEYRYSRINTLIFAFCHPVLLIAGRSLLRKAERRYFRRHPQPKTLFIGTSPQLISALGLAKKEHIAPFGLIVLDPVTPELALLAKDIPFLPVPDDWTAFLVDEPIASAFIAVNGDHPFLRHEIHTICTQIPDVKIMPDFGELPGLSLGIELMGGLPVINVHESPLRGPGAIAKRAFDIVASALVLILLSPVFALLALLVKCSSRGPIFYHQERMGLDGQKFLCFKFRSMPVAAEAQSGAVWAKPGDDRATVIGSYLRRSSLDELPQFFNVLIGDMSLVGPRPERPVFVREFRHKVPGYMLRHKVKAGITGWAQVNGWRGSTSIEKRIECDLFYIQNWTFWLDVKILFLTIEEVFSGKNAY